MRLPSSPQFPVWVYNPTTGTQTMYTVQIRHTEKGEQEQQKHTSACEPPHVVKSAVFALT